ncbi:hypothetical protein BDZ94DRAFT_800063 [Collybia nuda]|uniref:P-loop containing nucleoside triphosphate hydrolase protein n=1 Tax=Collybia nuda TaxID=64659 RepID=A0A9P5Y5M2_9AGAR|nr:hypothetical protein BDZ94DRAFT_800063 [Collybia nuda]
MDLENFNDIDENPSSVSLTSKTQSAKAALEQIDEIWYIAANRRARWMDLLGDYAGSEPFILDGESLLQIVLDDPLLAIGRNKEPSFQILHAFQILERTLIQFKQRSAEIEIVFWKTNRHATLKTGETSFVVASRTLARAILFKHLLKLGVAVHIFKDLDDPRWSSYEATKKPMFVMANDGGKPVDGDESSARRILCQRVFFFELLSRGIAVTLFKGAEYRDSKILSFVYEQSRTFEARKLFNKNFWDAVTTVNQTLDTELLEQSHDNDYYSITTTIDDGAQDDLPALLTSIAKEALEKDLSDYHLELLYLFITHFIIIRTVSIHDRARPLDRLSPNLLNVVLNEFLPSHFLAVAKLTSASSTSLDVDGRVYCSLVKTVVLQAPESITDLVDSSTYITVQRIWAAIGSPPLNFQRFSAHFPDQPPALSSTPAHEQPLQLLPFDNEIFNEELSLVHVPVHDSDEPENFSNLDFGAGTIFSDTQHWHNQKSLLPEHLGGKKPKPVDGWARRRALKRDQRDMARLQAHAATLTGASGGSLQQIKIPLVGSSKSPPVKSRVIVAKPTKKEKPLKSADKLRQKIQEEKTSTQDDAAQVWWQEQLTRMSKLSTHEKISLMGSLSRSKRHDEPYLGSEMRLYLIHLTILAWLEEDDRETGPIRDKYTVSIMRIVMDICDRSQLTPTISKNLELILVILGFSEYSKGIIPKAGTEIGGAPDKKKDDNADKKLSFKFVKLIKSKTGTPYHEFLHIVEHPVIWQLRLFGAFMDRSMDGAPDSRVAFKPDAWQRTVLDSIDANDSLLVVAPTSAGKTFISYYAMEKVLRDSDDGILVYIAPTKALVTQIAAEVYARFSKDLNGKSCWAVHTRDNRINDPQKCQILVTVPEMLAIMLLSPALARIWTSRIKRIILDEIHSIGQQEGGAVWEQIILLAPCPIIGLSATIGSPEIFNNWLASVQAAHGYKHKFIQYPHRYSHLRKFYYDLSGDHPQHFSGLDSSYQPTSRVKFLHPISLLSFGARSLPTDLALEAGDLLKLHDALKSYEHILDVNIDALEPVKFFTSNLRMLKQKDILEYEAELKAVVSKLISSYDALDRSSPLHGIIHKLEDPDIGKIPEFVLNTSPSRKTFTSNLIYLLADLNSRGELPTILFNFDRTDCEIMAKNLVISLRHGEAEWRAQSAEWQRKISEWEKWKLRSKERERLAERAQRQKKEPGDEQTVERSWESTFNPAEPTPAFSFAGSHTTYTKAERDSDINELARWTGTPSWALAALRRGIAVHHSGMNKRYRSLVESLFRQGYVRVVIATGTLALGINAPTKTSVFCGDSPYLTALMYRQCAGRAGRRGYDLLGNVVFYGLPLDRVQRLVLSKLPSLGGNFPLTSTLTLRLLNLLHGSDNAPVAVRAIKSLMSLPHVSFGSEAGRHQLLHHLRFSIEYLRRGRLLDKEGKPLNLFAIAAHLYYTEPSNFALVALLRSGVLHKICEQPSVADAKRDFMILMAHLFGRRYIPKVFANERNIGNLTKKYPSTIVLPSPSKLVLTVLAEHDSEILDIFTGYAITFAREHAPTLGPDFSLPISKLEYSASGGPTDPNIISPFHSYLHETAIPIVARSPFVANSGHGDRFRSVHELTRTVREGLYLNEHAIPSLSHLIATSDSKDGNVGLEHALNAYLLDFYTHGQVSTLAIANGIRRGDVWYLLDDFTMTLMTVKASLEQLLIKASKEFQSNVDDTEDSEPEDLDSGYGTFDRAGESVDNEIEEEDGGKSGVTFKRPSGVTDADWRVYATVAEVVSEFDEKFRAMWAR